MPALSARNDSSPVFLGGVISALILRVSFDPFPYDFLAWFALVPLFYSLHRNRHRPWRRFFHGVSFGLLLILWCNSWFFTALSPGPVGQNSTLDHLRAAIGSGLAWTVAALFIGLFAVASGRMLRSEHALSRVAGLPLLWMGLEVLRGPLAPIPSPWISGWLSLGYALSPAEPETQIASLVGVHGVSFAIVLCSSFLLECLFTPRFRLQVTYAVLAAAVPLAAYGHGRLTSPESVRVGDTPVAMISQIDDSPETVLQFASGVAASDPEIILWSDVALSPTAIGGAEDSRESLESFLTRLSSVWEPGESGGEDGATEKNSGRMGTVLMTDGGRLVAVYQSPRDQQPDSGPPEDRIYLTSRGAFVLGIDFDFLVSRRPRVASAGKAQLLVSSTRTREEWGENAHRQQLGMVSFRAVENRRWLVAASSTGAYVIDPYGRPTLELRRGFDSAGVESVSFLSERSFYTLHGWWLEPLSALGALGIILAGVLPRVRRGKRKGSRGQRVERPMEQEPHANQET